MLTKNIYILYPAGYGGNYLSWAINASDEDLCKTTVQSPVNTNKSLKYGGVGTSHLHHRVPTHQTIHYHLPWMIYNKPAGYKTYILNTNDDSVAFTISSILAYDIDPVFIVIHDGNDSDIRNYGKINCITKWPVFFAAAAATHEVNLTFDPYDYANSLEFRNLVATNKTIMTHMGYVDDNQYQKIKTRYECDLRWYDSRNLVNPHEVNTDYYIKRERFPDSCFFQINCIDIVSEKFPEMLDSILSKTKSSTRWDTSKIINSHKEYVMAQPNIQWFDSINKWRDTGALDQYLMSHSGIQGMVIMNILTELNIIDKDLVAEQKQWQEFYQKIKGKNWPNCDNEQEFFSLPSEIQLEMINDFNYIPKPREDKKLTTCKLQLANWKNLSTEKINSIYQSLRD